MRISFNPDSLHILPAGAERLKRGNHDELPIRWLEMRRGDETFSVAVGPVDYGGPDEELFEYSVTVG